MRTRASDAENEAWDHALALHRLSMADLDALGDDFEDLELDHYGKVYHDTLMRLVNTPSPDWRAFVTKLEAARFDGDQMANGMLDTLIADARRLASG